MVPVVCPDCNFVIEEGDEYIECDIFEFAQHLSTRMLKNLCKQGPWRRWGLCGQDSVLASLMSKLDKLDVIKAQCQNM